MTTKTPAKKPAAKKAPAKKRAPYKKSGKVRKNARGSGYRVAIGKKICAQLLLGVPLRKICEAPGMPNANTVYTWLEEHPDFEILYRRARELRAEVMLDEIIEIADDGRNDTYIVEDNNGKEIVKTDYDVIARSRLRVDTRKWAMGRIAPKRYGDKIHQEITGANGQPLQVVTATVSTTDANQAQMDYNRIMNGE